MHEYEGQYTYDDYLFANRLNYRSSRTTKITRGALFLLFVVAIFVVISSPDNILSWFFIAILVVLLGFPYTILPTLTRRAFAQQGQLHSQVRFVFDSGKIISTTSAGEATLTGLHRYMISDRMILLYIAPNTFIMLPRRFLGSDSEMEYVGNFLKGFPVT
ncbi:MAG: hypothetical protein PHV74_08195 [Dehalococcoidia bacterium]|nr:hypothetical protein [Dehalococcoidia bacterium]